MRGRSVFLGLALAGFAGCVSAAAQTPAEPFDRASVDWARGNGKGTIVGQGFYTSDLEPAPTTCAGSVVRLIPYTPLTVKQTDTWTAKVVWSKPPTPGHQPYPERVCTCDAQGNFNFEQLPAGKWIAFVSMPIKNRAGYTMFGQTGNYKAVVEIGEGETRKVILTNAR
jgi:hypothetical protein